MELANNRIAIRERSLPELLDLALHVVRAGGWRLGAALAAGIVPMLILNDLLLSNQIEFDFLNEFDIPAAYVTRMMVLIAWEIPLATAPATLLLGQWMFQNEPDARAIARDFRRLLPQLTWFQVIVRGAFGLVAYALPPLIIVLIVPYVGWPYLNEIILLERNPLRAGSSGRISTFRRSRLLHNAVLGEIFGRWLLSFFIAVLLITTLTFSLWSVLSMLSGAWHSSYLFVRLYLPLGTWLVVAYFTVVRFLSYLDLRIRREGWEVELAMRAEALRLTRHAA